MTNAQIIFKASQELAKSGVIKYTGRVIELEMDGRKVQLKETEDIHTYQVWKDLGYQVQKGQKAVTKLTIWKHATKRDEETNEENSRMFMKSAAFFSRSQVEKIG